MRKTMLVGLIAVAIATACAGKDAKKPNYRVRIYLLGAEIADPDILDRAKSLVSSMFSGIAVTIQWDGGVPTNASCPPDAEAEILIRLATNTPPSFLPEDPAYSRPYALSGERITVFYDRAVIPLQKLPRVAVIFLAHVIAHEITHVLQGAAWHSEQGLMTKQWTAQDLARMDFGPLPFGRNDAQLLRQGIERGGCANSPAALRASAQQPN